MGIIIIISVRGIDSSISCSRNFTRTVAVFTILTSAIEVYVTSIIKTNTEMLNLIQPVA